MNGFELGIVIYVTAMFTAGWVIHLIGFGTQTMWIDLLKFMGMALGTLTVLYLSHLAWLFVLSK